MDTINVKASDGPLKGKSFTVHSTTESFTHHAAPDGRYVITDGKAKWQKTTTPPTSTATTSNETAKPHNTPRTPHKG